MAETFESDVATTVTQYNVAVPLLEKGRYFTTKYMLSYISYALPS